LEQLLFMEAIAMTESGSSKPDIPRSKLLRKDEQIAVIVAFGVIGSILWWVLKRAPNTFNLGNVLPPTATSPFPFGQATPPTGQPNTETTPPPIGLAKPPTTQTDPSADATGTPGATSGTQKPSSDRAGANLPAIVGGAVGGAAVGLPQDATGTPGQKPPIPTSPDSTPVPSEAIDTPKPQIPVNPSLPDPVDALKFSDVPQGFWALPFIDGLSSRKVVSGLPGEGDTFEPDRPVTRAELATQIQSVFALENRQTPKQFKDIAATFWGANAVNKTNQGGFMNGYPEGDFRPDQPIPRLELLVALATGLNLPLPANPDTVLQIYQDKDQIPNWAKPKVAAATQAGLVVSHPDPGKLNGSQPATRADVAAILYQALVAGKEAPEIQSQYLVTPKP
jgi:S-layer homology domain